jgi:predicted dehydrogenase
MCHDVNLIRFLLGEPRGVRCVALKDKRHYCPRRVVVFDYGDFDCTLESALTQTPFFDEGGLIRFEKGWIRLAVHAPLRIGAPAEVEIFRNGRLEQPQPGWAWSFQREADHFIECVLNNKESRSSGRDSAKDIAVMEEIYKASLQ